MKETNTEILALLTALWKEFHSSEHIKVGLHKTLKRMEFRKINMLLADDTRVYPMTLLHWYPFNVTFPFGLN